jgi:hypothetical protein
VTARELRFFSRRSARSLIALVAGGVLGSSLAACGEDAEKQFAGMSSEVVGQPDGIGYRLRYLDPPWERVGNDPLVLGAAKVQFGAVDPASGAVSYPDLTPSPGSVSVLEIERSVANDVEIEGVITYPKYRLEVAVLRCDELDINVPRSESCAWQLNRTDVSNRGSAEFAEIFGQDGRDGHNYKGQHYYEFMTRVDETLRYRRVVYYETSERLVAIRLGFEANPALSELEVDQMVNAFEVLDDEVAEPTEGDAGADAGEQP